MKWFQHYSDAYTDFRLQDVIEDYGLEGYGFYWILCELVAQKGNSFQIKPKQNWKKAVQRVTKLDQKKIEELLNHLSDIELIDKKALKKNILCIPKMANYSDDYTKRVQRVFGHCSDTVRTKSDNVPLHNTTLHNTTIDNITLDKNKENLNELHKRLKENKSKLISKIAIK